MAPCVVMSRIVECILVEMYSVAEYCTSRPDTGFWVMSGQGAVAGLMSHCPWPMGEELGLRLGRNWYPTTCSNSNGGSSSSRIVESTLVEFLPPYTLSHQIRSGH